LYAKGFQLPIVGVEAGVKVEPTTVVLQVVHARWLNQLSDSYCTGGCGFSSAKQYA
jgi:hypothetical protein